MTIDEGATFEIESRWPAYKQRNVGIAFNFYGANFAKNMMTAIQLVRDHHEQLKSQGETVWSIPDDLKNTLDDLLTGAI